MCVLDNISKKNNTAMGLQGSAATKRKHEISLDSKSANTYTTLNCPPPPKAGRWSTATTTTPVNKMNHNELDHVSTNNNNNNDSQKNNEDLTAAESSITKLEVACESWTASVTETSTTSTEPVVDCISKLQAVAVPTDPWGSISTRSTLATTLLSADELEDDDDDFDDDYEEDESIIPTYCPITRYHPCSPRNQFQNSYSNSRPNYYSEPFPQQQCSRTGSHQHLRGGFSHWSSSGSNFYDPGNNYLPQQTNQQTIRCAENGKSYLDLGCSNSFNTPSNINGSSQQQQQQQQSRLQSAAAAAAMINGVGGMKRCCDGRNGTWCNTNKGCYRDTRLRIRNLSMFKLSRFRQVSEQSLYRSVLICNTLKYIDREIESEAKEMQQQQQQYHQQHQYLSHQHSLQNMHLQHHQMQHHNHHGDYIPSYHQQHHHHQQQQQQQQQQQFQVNGDCQHNYNQMNGSMLKQHTQQQQQQLYQQHPVQNSTSIHPYDHYPFRESNSGRVTPFPAINQPSTVVATSSNDCDSNDDDSNRAINWSSVLSLSSQSALDPLNNNDLFPILQTPTVIVTAQSSTTLASTTSTTASSSSSTTDSCTASTTACTTVPPSTVDVAAATTSPLTTTTTITQLTNSRSSSVVSSTVTSSSAAAAAAATVVAAAPPSTTTSSIWEYNFLDMDFGLGSEFTELVPTCKSTDDLFKNSSGVVSSMTHRYENELEHPAHIMVGS